jgi:hypothetical protein
MAKASAKAKAATNSITTTATIKKTIVLLKKKITRHAPAKSPARYTPGT